MSLREAVSFPHSADHFREEDIRHVLQRVGLEFAELVTWQFEVRVGQRRRKEMQPVSDPAVFMFLLDYAGSCLSV